jgi:hypothetical protein
MISTRLSSIIPPDFTGENDAESMQIEVDDDSLRTDKGTLRARARTT